MTFSDPPEIVTLRDVQVVVAPREGQIHGIRINGKTPIFCSKVEIHMTVEQVDIVLHRFLLKGDRGEEDYWSSE